MGEVVASQAEEAAIHCLGDIDSMVRAEAHAALKLMRDKKATAAPAKKTGKVVRHAEEVQVLPLCRRNDELREGTPLAPRWGGPRPRLPTLLGTPTLRKEGREARILRSLG